MAGEMQSRRTRCFEGRALRCRREAHLVPRQVESDHAAACEIPGDPSQLHVFAGGVLPHRTDDRDRLDQARVQPRQDRPDHLLHGQTVPKVQSRRPAHLEVVDVLGGGIDAQLQRDPFERFLGLHQGDRGLEVLDVLGLAGAVVGRDHPKPSPARQLLRGGDAYGTVEMRMQLGFLPAEIRRVGDYVSE